MVVHECRDQFDDAPLRVLFVVHGHEPPEWTTRACRLVSAWRNARVRLLGVADVVCPPFTSLIPPARRLYASARGALKQEEEQRVRRAIDRVLLILTGQIEVVREQSSPRGLAVTIAENAHDWEADVILVAAPTRIWQSWVWPGSVHDRLLRDSAAAVLAVPTALAPRRTARVFRIAQAVRLSRAIAPADPLASASLAP